VKAIIPSSLQESIYLSNHRETLLNRGIHSLVCEDPTIYRTLDHKWLCYEFLIRLDIHQKKTIPVRTDTSQQCREFVALKMKNGIPCYLKRTFDTMGSDEVIKVSTVEEYELAVKKLSKCPKTCLQPAETPASLQDLILQEGDLGVVFASQAIFHQGHLVSCYFTQVDPAILPMLCNLRKEMLLGRWNPHRKRLPPNLRANWLKGTSDICPDATQQMIGVLQRLGAATHYTGMMDVEFFISLGLSGRITSGSVATVLEVNPRFSGFLQATIGSGFIEDYMQLLTRHVQGDVERYLGEDWPRIRSKNHQPEANCGSMIKWHCRRFLGSITSLV